jgi:hypothetical protein
MRFGKAVIFLRNLSKITAILKGLVGDIFVPRHRINIGNIVYVKTF